MVTAEGIEWRFNVGADVLRLRASGAEAASGGRINRRRKFTGDLTSSSTSRLSRVGHRYGVEEALRSITGEQDVVGRDEWLAWWKKKQGAK